jgi:hypothetical protein
MNPWEIILPILWAGGLLGAGSAASKKIEGQLCAEYFFPATGILGLLIFILGLSGFLYKSIFIVITIILAIFLVWMVSQIYRDLITFIKSKPFYFIVILLPLLWYALASLAYPSSTDALYFHLGMPKLYALAGKIMYIPANLFSASPQISEMITTGFYALGLERGAQLFIMLVTAILVLSVWKRARDFDASGTITIFILFTIPIFMGQVTGSKNDYLLWGLSFFAIFKFLEFDQKGKLKYIILSAICAGMAAGTKAIGLALFGPLALIIIYNIVLGKYRAIHLLYFTFLFILFAAPWYIYSWIVAGNPVFPFFDNLFHSPYSSPLMNSFNKELAIKAVDRNLLNLIVTPFRIIFDPETYDGRLGYGLILFSGLIFFIRQIPQIMKTALAITLFYYLIWFFGFPFARFILPIAPFLAITGSYFVLQARRGGKALKLAVIVSLGLGVLLPLPSVVRDTLPRVASVVETTPKYEYLSGLRTLDPYQPHSGETIEALSYIKSWKYINENTPATSRIGILTSFWIRADGYYLDRDFLYLNPSEQNLYDFTVLRDNRAIKESLKKLGITHIVLDSLILEQFSSTSPWSKIPGFPQFAAGVFALRNYCETVGDQVYSNKGYRIYKLPDFII